MSKIFCFVLFVFHLSDVGFLLLFLFCKFWLAEGLGVSLWFLFIYFGGMEGAFCLLWGEERKIDENVFCARLIPKC